MSEIVTNGCQLRCVKFCGVTVSIPEIIQSQCRTLEVLCIGIIWEFGRALDHADFVLSFSHLPPHSLHRLHTLEISTRPRSDILQWITTWDMPSIRSCSIYLGYEAPPMAAYLRFFEIHGDKITSLGPIDLDLNPPYISHILRYCPLPQELTLWPQDFVTLPPHAINGLVGIQLRMQSVPSHDPSGLDYFMGIIERSMGLILDHRGTELAIVRLLQFDIIDFRLPGWKLEHVKAWTGWIERFEREEVRYEFSCGHLVRLSSEFVGMLYRDLSRTEV
jgi:hypothetical protein